MNFFDVEFSLSNLSKDEAQKQLEETLEKSNLLQVGDKKALLKIAYEVLLKIKLYYVFKRNNELKVNISGFQENFEENVIEITKKNLFSEWVNLTPTLSEIYNYVNHIVTNKYLHNKFDANKQKMIFFNYCLDAAFKVFNSSLKEAEEFVESKDFESLVENILR